MIIALSAPLASLPPADLFTLQALQYTMMAFLMVCLWEWFLAIADEIEMVRLGKRRRRYFLYAVYYLVRIGPIVFISGGLLLLSGFSTKASLFMLAFSNMIIMPAASALFLVRLQAIYMHNNYVKTFFFGCWLAILGFFIFQSCHGMIRCLGRDPSQCFNVTHIDAYGFIATAVYDTLIYLSISWRLASFARFDRWQDRLRSFVLGDGLGWLMKILLQSGQFYYFVMIVVTISTVTFLLCLPEDSMWKGITMTIIVTAASVMACRVFRELKLGFYVDPTTNDNPLSSIVFRDVRQQEVGEFELHSLQDRSSLNCHSEGGRELGDGSAHN